MSNKDDAYNTINSFGSVGIKKSELKKKFEGNFDSIIEELIKDNKISIAKKGTFLYCWTLENYLSFLLNSDLKFKILYDSIITIQNKINNYSDSIFKYLEKIDCELGQVKNSFTDIEDKMNDIKLNFSTISIEQKKENSKISIEKFKENFDDVLLKKSSSIGWVELSTVRNEMCEIFNISDNEFYKMVGELLECYSEKYELSSGGYEGVIIRGIIHGFVRCI